MDATLANPGFKLPEQESVLTPRFYTTDFEAAEQLDLTAQAEELQAMLAEMRADYNRDHFVRTKAFEQAWQQLDEAKRKVFLDYLERSCLSEFSGFLLFKELSRRTKKPQPLLAEILNLMARDEARHAGFLNKVMGDFCLSLDLPKLSKQRTYTWFPLSWVLYTVYLSEKIGYWRYILIYRQLQKHPEYSFNPLFDYFERWCQDENRHGDIFKALIRSQPRLWNNWRSRLWIRFFLLSVFVTHALTVHERAGFYEALGLNAVDYDQEVIRQTNNTSKRTFPVVLDVEHPAFFKGLQQMAQINNALSQLRKSTTPAWQKVVQSLPLRLRLVGQFCRLYLLKPIDMTNQAGMVL
jgi:magnesium-protoporphyrin IX monomethyl ester (oxidative) cyclase